jgi:DNA-binding FrmR family transcriptional regulator
MQIPFLFIYRILFDNPDTHWGILVMVHSQDKTKLLHRLSRIQGQLEAIKKTINEDDNDCEKAILLLKASHQAMKKFGEAYILEYMSSCFKEKRSTNNIETEVKKAIQAAFSL